MVKPMYGKGLVKMYVFTEPWRFVLKIKQNLITEIKMVDEELAQREKEIWNYLYSNGRIHKLQRLLGNEVSGWDKANYEPKPQDRFEKLSISQLLSNIKNN